MKIRKIPYYFFLFLLSLGASTIIGFLSFTGMFTLLPIVSLAIGSFALSVAYEWEIYIQNIKGALNKLFKLSQLKNQLATDYLLTQFTQDIIDTKAEDCPKFFKDYEAQLRLLHKFDHKQLNATSLAEKKRIEKILKDMEKWFALQLFAEDSEDKSSSEYQRSLSHWLKNQGLEEAKKTKALIEKRRSSYNWAKGFSAFAGTFMGLGITYLLVEAFAVLPFLAAIPFAFLPAIIIPLAVIAGAAYFFLIYNALTDMIHGDTLGKWYETIRGNLTGKMTVRRALMTVAAALLFTLTIALTICTAGTWWTIAKNARPLFDWMARLPSFIMGVINPAVIGGGQLIFNLENINASLRMIGEALPPEKTVEEAEVTSPDEAVEETKTTSPSKKKKNTENWLQRYNLFRFLLKLIITPLRLLLFLGHLISIGMTADQVPGIPKTVSAILGIICEFFEDLHYFAANFFHPKHKHGHAETKDLLKERFGEGGHDHSENIPDWILRSFFTYILPLYPAAAAWDYIAVRLVPPAPEAEELDWEKAFDKHRGLTSITIKPGAPRPSSDWQLEHSIYKIDHYLKTHFDPRSSYVNKELAMGKAIELKKLRDDLRQMDSAEAIKERLTQEAKKELYSQRRFFFFDVEGITNTTDFLTKLPEQIAVASSAGG